MLCLPSHGYILWVYFSIILMRDTSGLHCFDLNGTNGHRWGCWLCSSLSTLLFGCLRNYDRVLSGTVKSWNLYVFRSLVCMKPDQLTYLLLSASCLSIALLLSSLTAMPVTCELPGQGTLKRSLTTSSLGLRLTFAIRYVFWQWYLWYILLIYTEYQLCDVWLSKKYFPPHGIFPDLTY